MHTLTLLRTWLTSTFPRLRDDRGASLVEYALLLGLIFAVLLVAVGVVGETTSEGLVSAGSSGFIP
jgi:Flp pilus assembly pilin Flp